MEYWSEKVEQSGAKWSKVGQSGAYEVVVVLLPNWEEAKRD